MDGINNLQPFFDAAKEAGLWSLHDLDHTSSENSFIGNEES